MERDVFDAMCAAEQPEMRDEDRGRCLVVGVRAKNSAEIEAREKEWHATTKLGEGADWPVAWFAHEDDELPEPLSDVEAATVQQRYGISAEEWRELNRRSRR